MNDQEKFNKAQEDVKNLSKRPSNDELLALYSYYKQASTGDVEGSRPGMIKVKERAKWDAWNKLQGMNSDKAMESYTSLVEELINNYGMK